MYWYFLLCLKDCDCAHAQTKKGGVHIIFTGYSAALIASRGRVCKYEDGEAENISAALYLRRYTWNMQK